MRSALAIMRLIFLTVAISLTFAITTFEIMSGLPA